MEPNGTLTHRVLFEPMGILCEAEQGQSASDAARACGIALRSDCGGIGRCGKCRVVAHPEDCLSSMSAKERELLSPEQLSSGWRLACQAEIAGPGVITIPPDFLERGQVYGKTEIEGSHPVDPVIERIIVAPPHDLPIPGPAVHDLVEQTVLRAQALSGKEILFNEPAVIRELTAAICGREPATIVSHAYRGVTAVLGGERTHSLGLAVDIGTTTLAVYLCDLRTGKVIRSAGSANPQRLFGEDVISRIAFANERQGGAQRLQRLVVEEINHLGHMTLQAEGFDRSDIDEVVIVGNTTMESVFAGFHPYSLGISPYLPPCRFPGNFRADDLGLDFNAGANVYLFPMISGFVGGDTLGVILSDRPHERDEVSLIVDIGTNGEVVVGNRNGLWVTSCATGPAFEGAHISCGMRATSGAIHRVDIDPSTLKPAVSVLGSDPAMKPRGICGSGIIDAVAAMIRAGLLLPSGRIKEGMPGVASDELGIGRRFTLVPGEATESGREISIALLDIRQIQLAKAALFAGIKLLMLKAGIDRVDRVLLTGAFGARFDWRNAVAIGMLPKAVLDVPVQTVENAAGTGAIMALLDSRRRKEAEDLVEKIRFLELGEEPDFPIVFPSSMTFPAEEG